MKRRTLHFHEFLLLILALAILGFNEIQVKPIMHESLLMPPQDLKNFSLGYQEILADTLWIRSLQDIDLCGEAAVVKVSEEELSTKTVAEDLTDSPSQKVLPNENNKAKCENGWSARMIDAVTDLAPRFKMPYMVGATILSGVVRDNAGAAKIFKKGVERFPNDWQMSYRAAFHYMSAMGDYKTAAEYLVYSGKHGAPAWVYALAAKLETRLGQALLAKPILEEAIAADPSSKWAEHLQMRLDEINKTIEKGE